MSDLNNATLSKIKSLHQINVDSIEGWKLAIEEIEHTELQTLFRGILQNREQQAAELASYLESHGAEVDHDTSFLSTVHRWWLDAKESIASKDNTAVVEEADRGEESILKKYDDLVNDEAVRASSLHPVLQRQHAQVDADHNRVHAMKERLQAAR
ncbi:ferritin-like domain-containing protein [Phycisphaera mikurensis]|uniref:DUF2383 domain-containing protein n=1 Tax=Phycisphaera mikurensis (strain NBRC 102666 / KCTC 22515 / FYK2301M01) TaxID=1142394 RepID=I0IB17_PHYMF|nr:PA2169 family four-helix-bundle protein [Phycisphaera mikurensis]MBB6442574.1 uncharacterized protein (TIGR02284 family) [Phycisphaera mikurensis]BAM02455.1 hypothetical protein PSMK_02960 [Phycisphaera mikurensis NBRC 102666]